MGPNFCLRTVDSFFFLKGNSVTLSCKDHSLFMAGLHPNTPTHTGWVCLGMLVIWTAFKSGHHEEISFCLSGSWSVTVNGAAHHTQWAFQVELEVLHWCKGARCFSHGECEGPLISKIWEINHFRRETYTSGFFVRIPSEPYKRYAVIYIYLKVLFVFGTLTNIMYHIWSIIL